MPKTVIHVGPQDHGRRMSLKDFDHAEVQEGYIYELGRGVIIVSDVPGRRHLAQVHKLRAIYYAYNAAYPEQIHTIAAGNDCKILVSLLESERHPDLAIYKTSPPNGKDFWTKWVPEIVIEVVSPSSKKRDYDEKPEEYFLFGVQEYWILDARKQAMTVFRRLGSRWVKRTIRPPAIYRTKLLPSFEFSCALVFEAAEAVGE